MNLLNKINGKKTYIVAFILALLNLLVAFDVISPDNLAQINTVLSSLGLATLRAGVSKTN